MWIFVIEILLTNIIILNKKIGILRVNFYVPVSALIFSLGVTLDGGKRYTQTVERSFHISMAALEPPVSEGIIKENIYRSIYVVPLYSEKRRGKAFICFSSKTLLSWFVVNVGTICGITEHSLNIAVLAQHSTHIIFNDFNIFLVEFCEYTVLGSYLHHFLMILK